MFAPQLLASLRQAEHLVIFTGAGVSAESGIPTFRDALTGLWERYDPAQLASEKGFLDDPALVWGWYEWRRSKAILAEPNLAHHAIAQLQQLLPKLTLISQNVDDLHERAGSRQVLHLHGTLHQPHCIDCLQPYPLPREASCDISQSQRIAPPQCPCCTGLIRPGVVWFGESLPSEAWLNANTAARNCDVFMSIGTSGMVQPAAMLPKIAHDTGSQVIQINPETTELDAIADFNLHGKAGELLPQLVQAAFTQ